MARLPSISARATPRKKSSSSSSTSPKAASSAKTFSADTSSDSVRSSSAQQVSKAAKRAARRAQLTRSDDATHLSQKKSSSLGLTPTISKSALRRRKRKERDQAVLGHQGMDEIKDELQALVGDEGGQEGDHPAWDDAADPVARSEVQGGQAKSKAKVGSKMRKNVLAQELLRQPHLLKDLQSSQNGSSAISNPFALLRQHAQNSQGLTAPNAARSAKSGRDADVKMD